MTPAAKKLTEQLTKLPAVVRVSTVVPAGVIKRLVTRASEKRKKAAEHRAATAAIREAVFVRARGHCESCEDLPAVHLDHWLGGAGRRRQLQSVENTWALCVACDVARSHNAPSAAHWNRIFANHAKRHGYPALAHIVKAQQ